MKFEDRVKQFITISLYRNAIFLISANIVTALLGFVFWVVIARFYTETEVGYSSAIISAMNFIALLSLFGLNRSIIRFLPVTAHPIELINSYFTLGTLVSLIASLIFLAGIGLWSPATSFVLENPIFALTFVVTSVVCTLSLIVSSVFIARRQTRFVFLTHALSSLLKIPLPIAFALFLHSFGIVASWMISMVIAVLVAIMVFMPAVEYKFKPCVSFKKEYIKQTWKYAGRTYIAALLYNAPIMILPVVVLNVLGTRVNAYFYIAWVIAAVLNSIPGSVSESLFAESSYNLAKMRDNVKLAFKLIFILLLPALVILLLAGKWILLAFGPNYSANSLVLLWLLGGTSIFISVIRIYTALLRVTDKLLEIIIIEAIVAIVLLSATYFVLPLSGINGIGFVWLSVHGLLALILTFRMKRFIKEQEKNFLNSAAG